MALKLQVYKCSVCGNIVEVLHGGVGQLVCCELPMNLMEEKTADMAKEKHVPMIEKIEGGYRVTVGSTLHPMEEKHYIEWIELVADGKVYKQFLKPGDQPTAVFIVEAAVVSGREYCNVHGLWKS
jgi:superoxide reductase